MKSLMTTILLFLSVIVNAQQTDVMYVPNQSSLVLHITLNKLDGMSEEPIRQLAYNHLFI
jgi:hypothetical protein